MDFRSEDVQVTIKKRLIFSFSLTIFYLFPLLISGHYYADDLLHSVVGMTPWISNGRPLSDWLFHVVMAGGIFNDIAPLTQVSGAAIISLSLVLVSLRLNKNGTIWPVLAMFPIIGSPFFLENWSFRYDSLTMSCAVAAAIVPYAFQGVSIFKTAILSFFLLFISMCFYQAALNLYISFAAIFFILDIFKKRNTGAYKELTGRIIGLILANVIYSLTVKRFMVSGEYNLFHSQIASGSLSDVLTTITKNYEYLSYIFISAFSGTLKFYFVLPVVCTLALVTIASLKIFSCSKGGFMKIVDFTLLLASVVVACLAVFGPLLLLKNPVFSPRVLVGASGLLTLITISTYTISENNKYLKWVNVIPVCGMFILAFSYYNAQRTTDDLESIIVTEIKTSIAISGSEISGLAFKGTAPHSLQSKLAEKNFPIIGMIIFNDLNQDFLWGRLKMEAYGLQVPYVSISEITGDICTMKLVGDFGYYKIFRDNNFLLVNYDKESCPK